MKLIFFFAFAFTFVTCNPYGGLVTIATCNGAITQNWKFNSSTLQLVNGNGMCLDVQSNIAKDGQDVQVYSCMSDGRKNQQWSYSAVTSQIFGLGNLCLGVDGECAASGSYVVMKYCTPVTNGTLWRYDNGRYINGFGKCLSLAGKPTADVRIPLIIGHRGLPARFPENTMISFQAAIDGGADGIETDLRLTKDGKIVLSHDDTLDRSTNCTGKISSYTFDYITKNCDGGVKSGYPGNMVPSFEQVVQLCKKHDIFIVMDMKENGLVPEINTILTKNKYYQGIASMWYQQQLADMARLIPSVPRQRLNSTLPDAGSSAFFATETQQGVMGYSLGHSIVTSEFIRRAHQSLMSIVVWTPNSILDIKASINKGVDGIITDDTELAQWVALDVKTRSH